MSRKRHKQHRSPVPRADKVFTPDDVLQELHEVKALILTARDKAERKHSLKPQVKSAVSDIQVWEQMNDSYKGLCEADIFEVVPDMVADVRRAFNAHRASGPYLDASMLPCRSGYVFFDTLWPIGLPRVSAMRSLSWTMAKVATSNYGLVPAVQVNVYGPHYSSLYADILPLGEQYRDEWYKYGRKGMQTCGQLVWTLWMYFNSELVTRRTLRPWTRKDTPPKFRNIEHGAYRVVTLRRTTHPEDWEPGHRDVNWQGRWGVTDHWRHLGKYEGPRHKATPTAYGDGHICFICQARGQVIKVTYIKSAVKPKDRPDLPWLKTKPTINKLVR